MTAGPLSFLTTTGLLPGYQPEGLTRGLSIHIFPLEQVQLVNSSSASWPMLGKSREQLFTVSRPWC